MPENEKKHKKREGLRQARLKRGLSFDELAGLMGLNEDRTPRRWESGETTPHPRQRPLLAEHLGITLDELDLLLEDTSKGQIWMVPFKRNPYFTGREDLLERLHAILQTTHAALLTHAVTGLGGIGKTLLAVEYAYRYHKSDLVDHAVLWAQADTQEALFFSFQKIAQELDLPEKEQPNQQIIVNVVKRWLETHTDWLLIFDNVEDLQTLQAFLPDSGRKVTGHILLTTRLQTGGTLVAATLDVESMPLKDGETFLLRRAKLLELQQSLDQAESDSRKIAQMLCQEMGGLPLALDQAGAYIEETECSLVQYLERYQTQRASLLAKRGDLVHKDDHPQPVTVTFLLSLEKIAEKNPAAADLLRFCAFLAPDDIPEDLFRRCYTSLPSTLRSLVATPLLFEDAIVLIRRYSLVQRLATKHSLNIHRVVQAVIQDDLTKRNQRRDWERLIVTALAEVFEDAGQDTILSAYERYIPQALASIELIQQEQFRNQSAGHLLFLMGSYLTRHAQYEQAEELCQEALDLYQQMLGPDHPEVASNLVNLAQVYEEKRAHAKAQELLEYAIAVLEKESPRQHIRYAVAVGNLARCYWFQGKFSEAEQRAQQSLSLLKRYAEPESHHLAVALRLLATVYREQDKNQQAASLYQEALDIHEKLSPPDRLSKAYCLEAFATNDVKQGKYLLAEARYQEARHLFEDIWGKEHPDVASCLCRLADLYMRFKKYDKVEMYNQQALAIYERFGGSRHPEVNQPLQGLAILYHKVRNDRIEAEQLYKRAISIIEKSQGQYHPDLYAAYSNYAQLLWEKNARNEAEELLQRAEVLKQKMLGH